MQYLKSNLFQNLVTKLQAKPSQAQRFPSTKLVINRNTLNPQKNIKWGGTFHNTQSSNLEPPPGPTPKIGPKGLKVGQHQITTGPHKTNSQSWPNKDFSEDNNKLSLGQPFLSGFETLEGQLLIAPCVLRGQP